MELRVQVVPGAHLHVPVATDGGSEFGVRSGPGRAVREHEAGPVAAWTTPGSVPAWLGIRMEDPRGGDPHQHLRAGVSEPITERDAVVAGVEDEERDLTVIGQQGDEPLHLIDGGGHTIHGRREAQGVEWSCPAVRSPVQLADPLIGPPGHDGLAGGVLGRRVVEAPFGTALGVTAVSYTHLRAHETVLDLV